MNEERENKRLNYVLTARADSTLLKHISQSRVTTTVKIKLWFVTFLQLK